MEITNYNNNNVEGVKWSLREQSHWRTRSLESTRS